MGTREDYMRIAYSCAGEGFGHAARMVALYDELSERHELSLFVPRSVRTFVQRRIAGSARVPFGKTEIGSVPCFALEKKGNAIDYLSTAKAGISTAFGFPVAVTDLARELRAGGIDIVLSDFEPFLPMAARLAGIPVVQMNHPGIVERFVEADPSSWTAGIISLLMQGPWDRRVLVSFYGGDVGPVLRPSLASKAVEDRGFLAVNVKEESRPAILPALESMRGLPWRLFPSPGADFDEALATCTAVIAGAGHQTLSEALVLGKPVLAIPQDGQYEQLLNARMLERTGRGTWCAARDFPEALPRFLERLDDFRSRPFVPQGFSFSDSRTALVAALDRHFTELVPARSGDAAFRQGPKADRAAS